MGVDAGSLDRRISIEASERVDDGWQRTDAAWAPLATVWARYMPAKGDERFAAAARSASAPVAFQVRWSQLAATVRPAQHRVRFGEQVLEIVAVTEIGRRELIELQCIASDEPGPNDA